MTVHCVFYLNLFLKVSHLESFRTDSRDLIKIKLRKFKKKYSGKGHPEISNTLSQNTQHCSERDNSIPGVLELLSRGTLWAENLLKSKGETPNNSPVTTEHSQ